MSGLDDAPLPEEEISTSADDLPSLPEELVRLIFEGSCYDRATVLSICLTSKHYHELFQTYLSISVRFGSPSDIMEFTDSSFDKSIVRDIAFAPYEDKRVNDAKPGGLSQTFTTEILQKSDREIFQGCSRLRGLAFITSDNSSALGDPFLSLAKLLEPRYVLLTFSFIWQAGIIPRDPGGIINVLDALGSVTHLAFSWPFLSNTEWANEMRLFGSLTHVWIRINMRLWNAGIGKNLCAGVPLLESRGIHVLLTVHHYLPIPERMALGIIRRYVNPSDSLQHLRIEAEPNDGWNPKSFQWANELVQQFSESLD